MSPSELRRIAVYCASSTGTDPAFAGAAAALGAELARRRIGLVYGGGSVGLMGIVADAVLAGGGPVHGVITEALRDAEVGHGGLTTLDVVPTMHERKARMAELGDAFIALPGGFGTLDELCEVLTWSQLGIHAKPVALVNVSGYFDGLLTLLGRAVHDGLMRPAHRDLLRCASTAEEALDLLARPMPAPEPKWIDRA